MALLKHQLNTSQENKTNAQNNLCERERMQKIGLSSAKEDIQSP